MLSPRDAAHILAEIATLLELRGEPRQASRSFELASRTLLPLDVDDLTSLLPTDEGPAIGALAHCTAAVLDVLLGVAAHGDSQYL